MWGCPAPQRDPRVKGNFGGYPAAPGVGGTCAGIGAGSRGRTLETCPQPARVSFNGMPSGMGDRPLHYWDCATPSASRAIRVASRDRALPSHVRARVRRLVRALSRGRCRQAGSGHCLRFLRLRGRHPLARFHQGKARRNPARFILLDWWPPARRAPLADPCQRS
jgi:hypothetical protein